MSTRYGQRSTMIKIIKYTFFTIALALLASCNGTIGKQGKPIQMHYASYLRMQAADGYICADIVDPWDTTKTMHRYIILPKSAPTPAHAPEGTVVRTPLTNTIVYSAVHCSLLAEWGKLSAIRGVCDLKYIMMPKMHQLAKEDKVVDLGNSMQPDAEKMISLNPDAILLSPYKDDGGYGILGKSGVPIIECADYMETSPLGRAEWMKFYGLLFGCERQADSLFSAIEKQYLDMKKLAVKAQHQPTVFADMKEGDVWMMPGGKSTIGMYITDAGAKYMFDDYKQSGSVNIPAEKVIERCSKADFWLVKYNNGSRLNYKSLMALDPIYSELDAMKKHHVYACNTGIVPFYEDTPFHPERLLRDLVSIFHPELTKNYKSKYYIAL